MRLKHLTTRLSSKSSQYKSKDAVRHIKQMLLLNTGFGPIPESPGHWKDPLSMVLALPKLNRVSVSTFLFGLQGMGVGRRDWRVIREMRAAHSSAANLTNASKNQKFKVDFF